jgi:5'(3')-deoxyribonucleotidase
MAVKPIVFVDYDDVLFDQDGLLFDVLSCMDKPGIKRREDIEPGVSLFDAFELAGGQIGSLYSEWDFRKMDREMKVIDGAVEGVRKLSERYEAHLATARSQYCHKLLDPILTEHFEDSFSDYHFLGGGSKVECARKQGNVVAIVDDQLKNLEDIRVGEGIMGVLFSSYMNKRHECDNRIIRRADNWPAVTNLLGC